MTHAARHARMLLPYTPPPPPADGGRLPPPPSLWQRAQGFLASLAAQFTALANPHLPEARHEALARLEPLEKLVRALLIVRAVTFLLMTPNGRRLMRETPKSPFPQKPTPPSKRDSYILTIPQPAWSTIAQHQAPSAAAPPRTPSEASSPFRVCAWRFPIDFDTPPQPADRAPQKPSARPKSSAPDLTRRLAALTRILADPARPASRLARWFARLPREALQGLTETFVHVRRDWNHGVAEAIAAAAHVRRAAFFLLHPEPG